MRKEEYREKKGTWPICTGGVTEKKMKEEWRERRRGNTR